MSANKCKFCKKEFVNKYVLQKHQKTAKYCLKKQNVKNSIVYNCMYCEKQFNLQYDVTRHETTCKMKNNFVSQRINELELSLNNSKLTVQQQLQTITDLKFQVSVLQDKLANIAEKAASKPTTQINTRINKQVNQLLPLTQEHIQSQVPYLTIEHIKRGAQGYADFALEYAFKDRLACTDFSRRRVKYKDEEGNVIDDPDMKKVSKQFFQAIHDHNTTLTNQYGQELYNKLTDILQNAGDELTQEETDKLQLTQQRILQEISKVNTNRIDVTDIAKGNKSELLPEFVREVCATSSSIS